VPIIYQALMKMLITGASTILGSQVISRFKQYYPEIEIFTLDDLSGVDVISQLFELHKFESVMHLACAEVPDYNATRALLDLANAQWAGQHWFRRFLYVSAEDISINEQLIRAYADMTLVISTCTECFASSDFPVKYISVANDNMKQNKSVPMYTYGQDVDNWFWVADQATAVDVIFNQGEAGPIYKIGGMNTWKNQDKDYSDLISNKTYALEPLMANAYHMFFNKVKNLSAHLTINPKRMA
jgi:dTDP-glucose 4,6-dehydratase